MDQFQSCVRRTGGRLYYLPLSSILNYKTVIQGRSLVCDLARDVFLMYHCTVLSFSSQSIHCVEAPSRSNPAVAYCDRYSSRIELEKSSDDGVW